MESYFPILFLAGLATALVGFLALVGVAWVVRPRWGVGIFVFPPIALWFAAKHPKPARNPLLIVVIGMALAAFPPIYTRLTPVNLGPLDKMVANERHVTLTGWDRKDYGILSRLPDVVVLQMANPDVDDATLGPLRQMNSLRELDLNDTQISDEGLKVLADLPKLERLRLRKTRVTDKGFSQVLATKDSLKELDLRGTAIGPELVKNWKDAKPGRRAMQ